MSLELAFVDVRVESEVVLVSKERGYFAHRESQLKKILDALLKPIIGILHDTNAPSYLINDTIHLYRESREAEKQVLYSKRDVIQKKECVPFLPVGELREVEGSK